MAERSDGEDHLTDEGRQDPAELEIRHTEIFLSSPVSSSKARTRTAVAGAEPPSVGACKARLGIFL